MPEIVPLTRTSSIFAVTLPSSPGKPDQLEATAKEFRRTALVGSYVGVGVTQHSPPGRREVRECERVRCCPGRHKERRHFALEQLRQITLN